MLSENRRNHSKRMWSDFCMNPRGELWKKDENNFGSKLLKKMGWKKGEGLGKKGSGITEPIRLVQTHDSEGLGYSKQTSDYSWNWLSHRDDYDCLLNKLQEQHSAPSDSLNSQRPITDIQQTFDLEKKSKGSRRRVHYKRSIEGKNLSNRSQSDWKCILGIKRKRKCPLDSSPDSQQEGEGVQELLHTSTISSQEYFRTKRMKLDKSREMNGTTADLSEEVVCEDSIVEQETSVSADMKKKKKRKKTKKKKLEQERFKKGLEECESGCSDSAIGSELSGSCDGEPSTAATERVLSDVEEVRTGLETEPEKQNGAVSEERGQSDSDDPLPRTRDAQVEKENHCKAEDSLLIMRKFKKKKKKRRPKLKLILDVTNLEWRDTGPETEYKPISPNRANKKLDNETVVKPAGILKIGVSDCSQGVKKSVHFLNKLDVGYVPAKDSVRGGAWIWKRKNLLSSL